MSIAFGLFVERTVNRQRHRRPVELDSTRLHRMTADQEGSTGFQIPDPPPVDNTDLPRPPGLAAGNTGFLQSHPDPEDNRGYPRRPPVVDMRLVGSDGGSRRP